MPIMELNVKKISPKVHRVDNISGIKDNSYNAENTWHNILYTFRN